MNTETHASEERKKVGMLVPPPFLLLGLVAASVVVHTWLGWPKFSPLRASLGAAIVVASIVLIASCGKRFKAAGTPVRPTSPTTSIVSAGAYRFTRNPMYVGMAGVLAGLAVLSGSYLLGLALVAFVVVVHYGVVLPEEKYLQALHGSAYLEYKQHVRRWL